MKIWTCGSSPRIGSRNAWTLIKNFNRAGRLSNIWNFFLPARSKWIPVAIGDHGRNLVVHYDSESKQESMEWRHSGSPRPKYSECKNSVENFLPRFFVFKLVTSDCLSSKEPNSQRWVLSISAGAIEGHFEGKMSRDFSL